MTIGAITIPKNAGRNGRPVFMDVVQFAGDNAYPTGGTALTAALVAAIGASRNILAVLPVDCGGYVPVFDAATGKLKFLYGDNNNAADGPAIEVPNTTDLSAVTMKVLVVSN